MYMGFVCFAQLLLLCCTMNSDLNTLLTFDLDYKTKNSLMLIIVCLF